MSEVVEALELLSWLVSPVWLVLLLVVLTGVVYWAVVAWLGVVWLVRRLAGHPVPVAAEVERGQAQAEVERLYGEVAEAAVPGRVARHLAAAWRASDDPSGQAAGWELDAVLDGTLSIAAVAGADSPCAPSCTICGRPDDADVEDEALPAGGAR